MPRQTGPDVGSSLAGPIIDQFRPEGKLREYADVAYNSNALARFDWEEDFRGPLTVKTIDIPLFTSGGAANTFATTGSSNASRMVDFAGRLLSVQLIAEDALATSDTNYLTFLLTNNAQNGAGTTAMLDATGDANTTKATGGTAITAETGRSITVSATAANLRVASGDLLTFDGTATGTLANAVDLPVARLRFAVLPPTITARTTKTVGLLAAQPVSNTAGGEALFALGSTGEANVTGFDWGDQVTVPATKAPWFQCRLKVSGVAAATRFIWGLGSAYNATFDSVVSNAWFRLEGNSLALKAETDDGTTDNDDQDCAFTLVAGTFYTFTIDGTDTGNIRFWVDEEGNSGPSLVKTLAASAFTSSSLLQPFIAVQKDSGTGEQSITVDRVRVRHSRF